MSSAVFACFGFCSARRGDLDADVAGGLKVDADGDLEVGTDSDWDAADCAGLDDDDGLDVADDEGLEAAAGTNDGDDRLTRARSRLPECAAPLEVVFLSISFPCSDVPDFAIFPAPFCCVLP